MPDVPEFVMAQIKETPSHWLWYGPSTDRGYPMIDFKGERFSARRFIYELDRKLSKKKAVTVTCGNVMCVKPEHLA